MPNVRYRSLKIKNSVILVTEDLKYMLCCPNKKISESDKYYHGTGKLSILHFLMTFPQIDLLKKLVDEMKIDINVNDVLNRNALIHLIKNYDTIKHIYEECFSSCLNCLLDYKININQRDKDNNSAFFLLSKIFLIEEMKKIYNYKY